MLSIGERARQTKALWVMMLVIKIKYSVGKFWLRRDIHPQAGINFIYGSRPEELVRIVDHCTYSPPDGRQRWRVKNHLPWKIGLCVFERHPSLPGIKERNHSVIWDTENPGQGHTTSCWLGYVCYLSVVMQQHLTRYYNPDQDIIQLLCSVGQSVNLKQSPATIELRQILKQSRHGGSLRQEREILSPYDLFFHTVDRSVFVCQSIALTPKYFMNE